MSNEKEICLKVARNTPVQALATSMVQAHKESPESTIVLRAVGAMPLNQAIKAIIVANKDFIKHGVLATISPCFTTVTLATPTGNQDNTAIELKLNFNRA